MYNYHDDLINYDIWAHDAKSEYNLDWKDYVEYARKNYELRDCYKKTLERRLYRERNGYVNDEPNIEKK